MNTEHFIMEDGSKARIYDNGTLHEFFRQKFPDGITVEMPGMALVDLKVYDELKITEDFHTLSNTEFWGKINNTKGYLEYGDEGDLQAEMRFTPDTYHLLMAEDTYANRDDNIAVEDFDWDVKSATTFAHLHGQDANDMTVEITKGIESLRCLYIEGRPFPEVMDLVHRTGCNNEWELKQLLTLVNMHEKGLHGKPVPEIVEPLIREVMPDYDRNGHDTYQFRERKILFAVEQLLRNTGAVQREQFNLTAHFDPSDNNRAAREVVDAVNRLSANEPLDSHFAKAVRVDNRVDISAKTLHPKLYAQVEGVVRTHPDCLSYEYKPYKSVLSDAAYLVLATGQAVKGFLNKENLHMGHDYTLASRGMDGNIQARKLLNEPGKPFMQNLFTSVDAVHFPKDFEEGISVHHFLTAQQYLDSFLLQNVRFIESTEDPQKIFIDGRTPNFRLNCLRLNPEDTRIYQKAKAAGDEDSMNIVKQALASVYYREAIAAEKERVDAINRSHQVRKTQKDTLLARVTEAELYGKVDDLHIRCVIDGKLQKGRPLKGYNITVSHLKHDAALLGKDHLHYYTRFHESVLREMAANTFRDVLTGKAEQQQRTRGISR